jgi:hypothetical protein
MLLPNLLQWQRAIRGVEGMEFPDGHEFDITKDELREVTSPDGVIYSTTRNDSDEWLRDRDCILFSKDGKVERVAFPAMELRPQINVWVGPSQARFRCVRVAESQSDGGVAP